MSCPVLSRALRSDAEGFHKSAGDLPAGHDIYVANMTEMAAETWCKAQTNCSGFTARSAGGATSVKKIYFKQVALASTLCKRRKCVLSQSIHALQNLFRAMGADPSWVSYVKVATPSGPSPPATPHKGLVGSFHGMTILNSTHMTVTRGGDVPLRTTDGGATWAPMESPQLKLVSQVPIHIHTTTSVVLQP
eukprot:COSAG05_NODE_1040_length_6068_cov_46.397219_7_plen_191_part_00